MITTTTFKIRPVRAEDNPYIEAIIVGVLKEHGAEGEGFAGADPETKAIFEAYENEKSAYYVVTDSTEKVLGGAGYGPLKGGDQHVCEFQKMYLSKEARGHGLGQQLLDRCLQEAKEKGYTHCYLETLTHMDAAQSLYLKNGFQQIDGPMGDTGHFKIDRFYVKKL